MEAEKWKINSFPGRAEYLLMHKHLVGPATTPRLIELHEQMVASPFIEAQYMAGWAAAEAALISSGALPVSDRLLMLDAADDAWDSAIELAQESALRKADGGRPNTSTALRLQASRVFSPTMRALVTHSYTHETRLETFDALLGLSKQNAHELAHAERTRRMGPWGNHFGLAHEFTGMLGVNSLLSGKVLAFPSLARSGVGEHYPSATHDIQIWSLRRGRPTSQTPVEAKAGFSFEYDVPVVSGRKHFRIPNAAAAIALNEQFEKCRFNTASEEERLRVKEVQEAIIHMTRHHHSKTIGKHCIRISRCALLSHHEQIAPAS